MWKGCLLMLVALGAALYVEHQSIVARGLPEAWIVTSVLAVALMMLVGSLHGLVLAFVKRLNPETDSGSWQDGQLVRVGGQIRPMGAALKAPISQRDVVMYEYQMVRAVARGTELERSREPRVNGTQIVPCGLYTANRFIALRGRPSLEHFSEKNFWGEPYYPQAAGLLASATWTVPSLEDAMDAAKSVFSGEEYELPQHIINRRAIGFLLAPEGQPVAGTWESGPPRQLNGREAEEAIQQRLRQHVWSFHERVLEAGADVTVEGTYHANPPHIDIARTVRSTQHTLRPGLAAKSASREWIQALIGVMVIAAIVGGMHYVVYADDGELYRALVEWVREAC